MRHTPFRLPSVLAGSLATVAVLALGACGGSDQNAADPATTEPAPATTPTSPASSTPSNTTTSTPTDTAEPTGAPSSVPAQQGTVPVQFVGPGNVLYPYPTATGTDADSLLAALTSTPADPDYRTLWTADAITALSFNGKTATVTLAAGATTGNAAQGKLAVQQLAWTLKSAAGITTVTFQVDGKPASTVLGAAVSTPEKARNATRFLSMVTIGAPLEGAAVQGTFTASGTSNGPEAWLGWQVVGADGAVAKEGFTTAEGWMDKLYPWKASIDLSGVEAGTYTFRAYLDDPSGDEGKKPGEDTRTIVVS